MSVKYTVKNVSPLGELDVALLRLTVAAGATVDVTEAQAERMLAQVDVWKPVSKAAKDLHDKLHALPAEVDPDPDLDPDDTTDTDAQSEDQE